MKVRAKHLSAVWVLAGAAALAQSPGQTVPVTLDAFVRAEILNGSWKFPEARPAS